MATAPHVARCGASCGALTVYYTGDLEQRVETKAVRGYTLHLSICRFAQYFRLLRPSERSVATITDVRTLKS